MANYNPELVKALRDTAEKLRTGIKYEWGHMGRCNCGHLVQTITKLNDKEIVKAVDNQLDEWSEHANDYCNGTGGSVEQLFLSLKSIGFGHKDFIHLEHLSDQKVLSKLAERGRKLRRNNPDHVSLYMNTMADLLEEEKI